MTPSDARVASPSPVAPIGGFFETHAPDGCAAGRSVLDAWTQGRPYAAFVNARSAFAALAAMFPEATVWLPAFLCRDLMQPAYAARTRFYPVVDGFEPDLDGVEAQANAGDLVLVAAYFGLPIGARARQVFERRADLRLVEDRAQALAPGRGAGRGWRLYSPRKLLGVADGGLLVAPDASGAIPRPGGPADATALWAAPRLRAADPLGRDNAAWHAANQAKEAAMTIGSQAMTPESLAILANTSLDSLTVPRLRNWRVLDSRLRSLSALPCNPPAPPLGYVLRLDPDRRDEVLRGLHAARIFAAVHWPRIGAPGADFPREAQLARELITLPCDHRYGEADMTRIADGVAALLA